MTERCAADGDAGTARICYIWVRVLSGPWSVGNCSRRGGKSRDGHMADFHQEGIITNLHGLYDTFDREGGPWATWSASWRAMLNASG